MNQVTASTGQVRLTTLYGAVTDNDIILASGHSISAPSGSITLQAANSLLIGGSVLASGRLTFAVDQQLNGVKPARGGTVSLVSATLAGRQILLLGGDNSDVLDAAGQSIPVIAYGYGGNDTITGGNGNDQIYGGSGTDVIVDGSGNDLIVAGSGIGDVITAGGGNDTIYGSSNGGDSINGGSGNDSIYGLGGGDTINGGAGNDLIVSGPGNDTLIGGGGSDTIYGGAGNDVIYAFEPASMGGIDDGAARFIYGGTGNDTIYGGTGDDVIHGGGGSDDITLGNGAATVYGGAGNNLIQGGNGGDVIYGSPTGNDQITGGNGNDRIIAGNGNDHITLGAGNDTVTAGTGNDVITGGAGSDVIIGGGGTDTITGHTTTSAAVDYIYGDVGTAGSVTANLTDVVEVGYASDDSYYVAPIPVPAIVNYSAQLASVTLPDGTVETGRWGDLAGSASGEGLSGDAASLATAPSVAVDAAGDQFIAWTDTRNGSPQVFVAELIGGAWVQLGGSASGNSTAAGVSATDIAALDPSITVDSTGAPIVSWTAEHANGTSDIYVARYNSGTQTWTAQGTSLTGGGISGTGAASGSHIVATTGGPMVVWLDESSGSQSVYAKIFNGTTWNAIGGSASGTGLAGGATADVRNLTAATDGSRVAVAWSGFDPASGVRQIYLEEYSGGAFSAINGSATGSGVSGALGSSSLPGYVSNNATPSVAYFQGSLFVAWQTESDQGTALAVASYANGSGRPETLVNLIDTPAMPSAPTLSAGGNALRLAWINTPLLDQPTDLYVMRYNGTAFAEELPGEAQGGGISLTGGAATALALATDASGRSTLVWEDTSSGHAQIYARGMSSTVTQSFVAAAGTSIQSILNSQSFTAGDVILVEGTHTENLTLSAADSGVMIYGAPGAVLNGSITVAAGAAGVIVQRLDVTGAVTVNGAANFVLTESSAAAVTLNGGAGVQITYNNLSGNITLNGALSGALIDHNSVSAATGVDVEALSGAVPSNLTVSNNTINAGTGIYLNAAAATGSIEDNTVSASSVGLKINVAFAGLISGNNFTSSGTGLIYGAAAALTGNTFSGTAGVPGTVGVNTTVAGTTSGLGFVAGSGINHIVGNSTGVVSTGAQFQLLDIDGNTVGVTGSGIIGGNALATANLIENNTTGVGHFLGIIQYNRFSGNGTAISVTADMSAQVNGTRIWYNLFYNNTGYGILVNDASNVRIYLNTFYSLTGDNIHLENGSSNVEIQGNILWAQGGYDIYVANNSQAGFFSDYNDLYKTGAGKLVYWTQDFLDILDWQDDVARYDLHSIGSTVVNPGWANPQFVDIDAGNFNVWPTIADLRFTSPTQGAANVLLDQAVPTFEQGQNLLTNPSFESGTAKWTFNTGGSVTRRRAWRL